MIKVNGRGLEKRQPFLNGNLFIMEKSINYKEGDRIICVTEFPEIEEFRPPQKGKVYTCENLLVMNGHESVHLVEYNFPGPDVIHFKDGTRHAIRTPSTRICFGAHHFAKVESYPDHTSEIAQQFKEHPDTVDQPVKILETVN